MIGVLRQFLRARDRFHVRFRLGKRFEIALWERPGNYLDDDALAKMVDDLRTVAAAGQKGKPVPMYGALLGDREDMKRRVITVAYERKTGRPVGFNALAYLDIYQGVELNSVMHLGLTFIDPDFQRQYIPDLLYGASTFLLFFKRGLRSNWISNVTQVPSVVGHTAKKFFDVYPSPYPGARQSFTHLTLSRAIMRDHRDAFGVGDDAWFDEARQVIANAYTGGSDDLAKTFDEAPKHRDEVVNEMCRTWLDYDRGDDVLQLGRFTMRTALNFLRMKMPEGAAFGFFFASANLVVLGVLTPVVRWLVPPESRSSRSERGHAPEVEKAPPQLETSLNE